MTSATHAMEIADILDEYYVRAVPPEGMTGQAASADEFKKAFRNYPAGVAVITADPGEGPVGLTATSVISLSAEPPILAFSLSALSSATPGVLASDTVVVHMLCAEQLDLAQTFATSGIDRFAGTDWSRLETGEPYLCGAETWLRGKIVNRMTAGSSIVVAVRVLEAHVDLPATADEQPPLVYHNRQWHSLGNHSRIG